MLTEDQKKSKCGLPWIEERAGRGAIGKLQPIPFNGLFWPDSYLGLTGCSHHLFSCILPPCLSHPLVQPVPDRRMGPHQTPQAAGSRCHNQQKPNSPPKHTWGVFCRVFPCRVTRPHWELLSRSSGRPSIPLGVPAWRSSGFAFVSHGNQLQFLGKESGTN